MSLYGADNHKYIHADLALVDVAKYERLARSRQPVVRVGIMSIVQALFQDRCLVLVVMEMKWTIVVLRWRERQPETP